MSNLAWNICLLQTPPPNFVEQLFFFGTTILTTKLLLALLIITIWPFYHSPFFLHPQLFSLSFSLFLSSFITHSTLLSSSLISPPLFLSLVSLKPLMCYFFYIVKSYFGYFLFWIICKTKTCFYFVKSIRKK